MANPTIQYLEKYAQEESKLFAQFPYQYQYVLCIPAYNESCHLLQRLQNLPATDNSVLIILIINSPDKNIDANANIANAALSAAIGNTLNKLTLNKQEQGEKSCAGKNPKITLFELPTANHHLLLVERWQGEHRIPHKQGVGLARKIICDIACRLIHQGNIAKPWIFNTDADVTLPKDYFSAVEAIPPTGVSACLYAFQHVARSNLQQAVKIAHVLYEISLYYYVLGLKWANSPYGFQSIGSTIAVHYQYYAKVRGFPKRNAAEDFYLLNKLAKHGKIVELERVRIYIDARTSQRVPFGTGAAVARISTLNNPLEEYLYYSPRVFIALKLWLASIPSLWDVKDKGQKQGLKIALSKQFRDKDQLKGICEALSQLKIDAALSHGYRQCKNRESFCRHMHSWFDGFKTLKLIHTLRNEHFPNVSLLTICHNNPFLKPILQTEQPIKPAAILARISAIVVKNALIAE